MDGSQPLDPRKTIFVGGVPRPLRAGTHCSTGRVGCAAWFGEHWGKSQPGSEGISSVGDTSCPQVVLREKWSQPRAQFGFALCRSGAGDDHGPALRRGLLRRHRHRPRAQVPQGGRAGGLLQPTELHCCYQRPLRAAAARGD